MARPKVECLACGKSYPARYFLKHHCKGQPVVRRDFPCTLCEKVCFYKSHIIKHFLRDHGIAKANLPPEIARMKREDRPRFPCIYCKKVITQAIRHKCYSNPPPAPAPPPAPPQPLQLKRVVVSLERLSLSIEEIQKHLNPPQPSTSSGPITRLASRKNPQPSTSSGPITRLASRLGGLTPLVNPPRYLLPSDHPLSDSDSDSSATSATSISSSDSIAKPKQKQIRKKKVAGGKAGKLIPPRTGTWRSTSDIPINITRHILAVYKSFQFSKILDHQVRMRVIDGKFNQAYYKLLIANSAGRCSVDAVNLIKLVFNESRARPVYTSPNPHGAG